MVYWCACGGCCQHAFVLPRRAIASLVGTPTRLSDHGSPHGTGVYILASYHMRLMSSFLNDTKPLRIFKGLRHSIDKRAITHSPMGKQLKVSWRLGREDGLSCNELQAVQLHA